MKMKILLTIAGFLFLVVTTQAQISKGEIFLGGSGGGYSSNSTANDQFTNFNKYSNAYMKLQAGKVIKNNTVAGVIGSYSWNNNNNSVSPDSNFTKANSFSAGLFYRKYTMLLKNFYFFGEINGVYIHSELHQVTNSYFNTAVYYYNLDTKTNGATISFIPGLSYAVCKKMYIELVMPNILSLTYAKSKSVTAQGTPVALSNFKTNTFSGNVNLSSNLLNNLGIGFNFIF